jgi:hypothetical protein
LLAESRAPSLPAVELPESTLATFALGLIAAPVLAAAGEPTADEPPELSYLRACRDALGTTAEARASALRLQFSVGDRLVRLGGPATGVAADLALLRLRAQLGLTPAEVLTAALVLATERELRVGRAMAFLQDPIGGSRPMVGAIEALAVVCEVGRSPVDELAAGAALATGLLRFADAAAPLPERSLAMPDWIALALSGLPAGRPGCELAGADETPIALPPSMLATAQRHAASWREASGSRTLVVRVGMAAEGRAVAAALAGAAGRRAVFITGDDLRGIVPWLLAADLLPVFTVRLAPSEQWTVPDLVGYRGPVVVVIGPDGSVDDRTGPAVIWTVTVPDAGERLGLWQSALPEAPAVAARLAADHRHGAGRIAELGRLARQRATFEQRSAPTFDDVAAAAWLGGVTGLDALAQPMPTRVPDDALVAPPIVARELGLLVARCRRRESLIDGLGVSAATRYRPGVKALFVGPSGTGKTLAASWLATRLGLPLYRVDVAAVVSKYIGETEKNLAELLARAEHAEVVLLFDEADSLFGKRTEVKQSTDRFANAQTNYLLQRIELYEGIVVLTSNSRSRFDSAFSRRLDVVVDFPPPEAEERRELWRRHLGAGHGLEPRQLNQLAATVDLVGGHIRNAVLTAALIAGERGRAITWEDVLVGLGSEYRKLGKQVPPALTAGDGRARG